MIVGEFNETIRSLTLIFVCQSNLLQIKKISDLQNKDISRYVQRHADLYVYVAHTNRSALRCYLKACQQYVHVRNRPGYQVCEHVVTLLLVHEAATVY